MLDKIKKNDFLYYTKAGIACYNRNNLRLK